MSKKFGRQRYFVSKELRLSIAIIILWSLLITAFFTYFAQELSGRIGHGILLFTIITAGYIFIVVVLTMFFSHRLLGPFQRLKTEIRLIKSGEYQRRLNVRQNDDIYIRSFIIQVNSLLDDFQTVHRYRQDLIGKIDSEIIHMIRLIEEGEPSKEKLREKILSLHRKLKLLEQERPE